MHTIHLPLLLTLGALLCGAAYAQESAPPARELLLGLTAESRLAGTSGSLRGARFVAGVLKQAGWRVEVDQRVVLLSLPRRIDFSIFAEAGSSAAMLERHERFDPDAIPAGDVPMYCAYSASGVVRGPVVDAGQGLRADFERLVVQGVALQGCVALVRYGGSYRGIKVDLAAEFGCAAVLLFTPAEVDGGGRGLTWPNGPWKPDTLAQSGSISPMGRAPGDPSTPGFASPAPGVKVARLGARELALQLPSIPAIPIGAREAHLILDGLRRPTPKNGVSTTERSGPGPIEVELGVDAPRDLRTIYNVIATLDGHDQKLVIAGNHRDAWMRGANDAGSGSVALLRAAQQLGERARAGTRLQHTLLLGFWDAEEFGLIGSTEWAEGNAKRLQSDALVYINGDTAVSGTRFGASGSPGMLNSLLAVLDRLPSAGASETLGQQWRARFESGVPSLALPGSGSDFAAFQHHLGVPVIDFSFGGNSGGQYHTAFDDFAMVERYLDPDFSGHELAAQFLVELLSDYAERPEGGFDNAEAARTLAAIVRAAGLEQEGGKFWLGEHRAERLALALDACALVAGVQATSQNLYAALAEPQGLPGRPWYRNSLWAPGLETGYSSETLPGLRHAARRGEGFLAAELTRVIARIENVAATWRGSSR